VANARRTSSRGSRPASAASASGAGSVVSPQPPIQRVEPRPAEAICCCRPADGESASAPNRAHLGCYAILLGSASLCSLAAAMTADLWVRTRESVAVPPADDGHSAAATLNSASYDYEYYPDYYEDEPLRGLGPADGRPMSFSEVQFDVGLWSVCPTDETARKGERERARRRKGRSITLSRYVPRNEGD